MSATLAFLIGLWIVCDLLIKVANSFSAYLAMTVSKRMLTKAEKQMDKENYL